MNIWITGSAGFLGKRLAHAFKNSGAKVVGFSRRSSEVVDESIVVDLSNSGAVETMRNAATSTGAPDVVIHAASKQPGVGNFAEFVRSNVHATFNLIQGIRDSPPRQIVYTSTLSVYANGVALPVSEEAPPVSPQPYAATKRWSEEVVQCWKQSQVTVLRLPSLYGKGQADSFIDGLARQALRDDPIELFSEGQLIREALHVSDVVSAIVSCVRQSPSAQFCVMNLGCGRPITTFEYAQALTEALGSKSNLIKSNREAPQSNLWADIALARRTIGFNPTELRESMRNYANELRA